MNYSDQAYNLRPLFDESKRLAVEIAMRIFVQQYSSNKLITDDIIDKADRFAKQIKQWKDKEFKLALQKLEEQGTEPDYSDLFGE